jgi:hypothetical protein
MKFQSALIAAAAAAFIVAALSSPEEVVRAQTQAPAKGASRSSATAGQTPDFRPVLDRYCVGCHNPRTKAGSLVLDANAADLQHVSEHAELWEKVIWKLRSASMPPIGLPRPDKATYDAFAGTLERTLDAAWSASPNPGRTPALHRLNRAEYKNAIRDLLALDIDIAAMLPTDSGSYGFDNIAGVLTLSPALMDRYLSAAERVSSVAVGAVVPPTSDMYRVAGDLIQEDRFAGLPFGTRGGAGISYTFPQDGEYEFRLRLGRNQIDGIPGLAEPSQIEVSIDGERVQMFTVGGTPARPQNPAGGRPASPTTAGQGSAATALTAPKASRGDFNAPRPADPNAPPPPDAADAKLHFRVPVKAGQRNVVVSFIKRSDAMPETLMYPYMRVNAGQGGESRFQPYLASVVISGPFDGKRPVTSASRARIFSCDPSQPQKTSGGPVLSEEACARQILSTVARRAYRRPATDADVTTLMSFFRQGRQNRTFDEGVELALQRVLVDPDFLFRVEHDKDVSGPYRVSDIELASRVSFFLWSSIPDDALLDLAIKGRLHEPAVLEQQVRRMIKDPRANALVENFAGQWLYLRNVPSLSPNDKLFPEVDESLRQAMRRETELFFDSIIREDHNVVDLLGANYTFVNERLARHYGIPNITGTDFRRVTVTDPNRGGLLGQAAILAATSEPTRTSPVRRGKWVLENLLGAPPPPPPPDVPSLKETEVNSRKVLSMRAQMEEHRKNPACASCHKLMDPIGLALENFDALGRWRTSDHWMLTVEDQKWRLNEADAQIDAAGQLPDGTPFVGPAGLKQALLAHSDQFVSTFVEKLMIYALGRGVEYYDRPSIRAIVKRAAANDNRFSSIVLGVVNSAPFQMRTSSATAPVSTSSAH